MPATGLDFSYRSATLWLVEMIFAPQDPEFSARVRSSFERQRVMAALGVTLAHVDPGRVELELAFDPRLTQQHGFMHAGIVATALDSACGYAAFSLMPADAGVLTVEYKINFLAPAVADRFLLIGTVDEPSADASLSAWPSSWTPTVTTFVRASPRFGA